MLRHVKEFGGIFDQIRRENATVQIFVAQDVDGLCTLRILTALFKCEEVKYDITPVANYDSLKRACAELVKGNEKLKTIFVINCGAMVDLGGTIFKEDIITERQSVYVIDAHRPLHLKNIFGRNRNNIHFITDETIQAEIFKPFVELFSKKSDDQVQHIWSVIAPLDNFHGQPDVVVEEVDTRERNGNDMDEDDDDAEAAYLHDMEDDDEDLEDFIEQDEDDDPFYDDEEYVDGRERNSRRQVEEDTFNLGARERDFRSKEDFNIYKLAARYYHKTKFGSPSSHVLYQCILNTKTSLLSTNELHNQALWSAIVGITEQFELSRIDLRTYSVLVNEYWQIVLRCNQVARPQMQTEEGDMIPISDDERIQQVDEPRLMLYRHWNLYESMLSSKYLVAQLGTYKQHGLDKLKNLLATIGTKEIDAQQHYTNMLKDDRQHFFKRLKAERTDYRIPEIMYKSFLKHYGITFQVSASDMVHSLIALMESPLESGTNGTSGTEWEHNFYKAYEALNGNISLIKRGISRAINMQRAVSKVITAKMETPIEQSRTSMFRHIQLKSLNLTSFGSDLSEFEQSSFGYKDDKEAKTDSNLFMSPMSVARLGLYFMEILEGMDNRRLPVVISVPFSSDGARTELLVGVSASASGHAFKKTYKSLELTSVKQVGFGSSAIVIPADVKTDFISVLFLTMGGGSKTTSTN